MKLEDAIASGHDFHMSIGEHKSVTLFVLGVHVFVRGGPKDQEPVNFSMSEVLSTLWVLAPPKAAYEAAWDACEKKIEETKMTFYTPKGYFHLGWDAGRKHEMEKV